ncbi:hypothetical protein HYH03_018997 [Edaphochlamys debaryana]|uniref:Uncharacterized protein n=1 Tax=Edaphochlamys debaryana TaxID=47281 RepID=A0A835XFH5_9CHLO|nr:hypothetical protein HYH03_018997 [Edaphochlamys debaryana]|eukprot:KAG2482047.1 hypothetical protein HYH03_018997 [Edaphochlamys debaryana]
MNCGSCLDDGHGPVAYQNWINSESARDWHMATNLTATYPDVHTLYYTSNRGASVPLFHNVFHQRRLHELGLRPSTAFGCAYNMLFFPKEETLAVMGEELKQVIHWWSGYGRTAAMRAMREMSIHAWATHTGAV